MPTDAAEFGFENRRAFCLLGCLGARAAAGGQHLHAWIEYIWKALLTPASLHTRIMPAPSPTPCTMRYTQCSPQGQEAIKTFHYHPRTRRGPPQRSFAVGLVGARLNGLVGAGQSSRRKGCRVCRQKIPSITKRYTRLRPGFLLFLSLLSAHRGPLKSARIQIGRLLCLARAGAFDKPKHTPARNKRPKE